MSNFETASEQQLTSQEAFPNILHRTIYYALKFRNALQSDHRARQEAEAVKAIRTVPGIIFDRGDEADIVGIRRQRREELVTQGHEDVQRYMLDHHFGTREFQDIMLARIEE